MDAKILVISSSLNPESTSRILAKQACTYLEQKQAVFDYLDLEQLSLPFCDGNKVFHLSEIKELENRISRYQGLLISTPVYNFDVNSALKNLIELTGHGWLDKVVGFLCTAGSRRSFMSVQSFASSLMLDFRCLIIPRFVFATSDDFIQGELHNKKIQERIQNLAETVMYLSTVWPQIKL